MNSLLDRDNYVARVLHAYRTTPGTTGHARAADRKLAITLHQRGIDLALVEAALRLGALRRELRGDSQPLPLVRALHYFMPVLEELLANPPHPAYLDYIQRRPAPLASQQPHAFGVDDAEIPDEPACHADADR